MEKFFTECAFMECKMKKRIFLFFSVILAICTVFTSLSASAVSYLIDKTEEVVDIDVSGAEALCQTDDGYVWIAQYSGLTRYDSKEFVSYKSFEENGVSYDIINVRNLAQKDNILYVMTYNNFFRYTDHTFSRIDLGFDAVKASLAKENLTIELFDLEYDKTNDIIYICSNVGLFTYDVKKGTAGFIEETKGKTVNGAVADPARNRFFYQLGDGIYNSEHAKVIDNSLILATYIFGDTMYACTTTGLIGYDLAANALSSVQYPMITDQVNCVMYSEHDNVLFAGCEKEGVYCIYSDGDYSLMDNLENKTQIVDLMIDYEGNLWVASHNVSSSGVSLITKNALLDLLYDDVLWASDKYANKSKTVYALERRDDILYICLGKTGLVFFDINSNKIVPADGSDNPVMLKVQEYFAAKGVAVESVPYDFRDVEYFNGKLYFADYGLGIIEYDPVTGDTVIYDNDFLGDTANITSLKEDKEETYQAGDLANIRCLRAFDGFLVAGYQSGGVFKFDGSKISVYHTDKSTIYISKTDDGRIAFNHTAGIFTISDDFTKTEEISTEKQVSGNRLKFLVDGGKVYYNLNGRFFCRETVNGNVVNREITIPYVKGSIVEIAKVKARDGSGNTVYKYVIASQTQAYITDSLDASNLDQSGRLIDYELYDATNGLRPIQANTSGYYDEELYRYYFQTTDGIFVYDFASSKDQDMPTKIAVSSIDVDGVSLNGSKIKLKKETSRIAFNLSILEFKPNKGHTICYKLDGVDSDYVQINDDNLTVSYTNIAGGTYTFHVYVLDSNGQMSNRVDIVLVKEKQIYEQVWFWIVIGVFTLLLMGLVNFLIIHRKAKNARAREAELKGITIESIEAIARTIDAKDAYTNGHSIRVGHYSKIIAEALGMQGDSLTNLYYTALLHDIGKIGIPDAILNKPGRLTDDEFAIMKNHTEKGSKILKDISTIPNIVEGAKSHHEKYGGGGYPEGLRGEDIPLIARIICCADCFDAMATKRVYKEPYPKEKIIAEFERCKGIQFDPEIADVVIKLIKEGKLRAE